MKYITLKKQHWLGYAGGSRYLERASNQCTGMKNHRRHRSLKKKDRTTYDPVRGGASCTYVSGHGPPDATADYFRFFVKNFTNSTSCY